MSAAARKRIAAAQRRRWAAFKKTKAPIRSHCQSGDPHLPLATVRVASRIYTIESDHVKEFVADLRSRGLAKNTIRRAITTLRALLRDQR